MWDYDPGPVLQLSADKEFENENRKYKGSYEDPTLYFSLKNTVEKILQETNYEFDELFKLFKESYQGVFEMDKLFPLFKRAWNELKSKS